LSLPWSSEHALSRDELAARLARSLEGLQYAGDVRVGAGISPDWYGEGWDCDVFRFVDTSSTPWLCKIPKRPEVEESIRKEAAILEELAEVEPGLAPRLGLRGRPGELPWEWIAVSIAPGCCLLENLHRIDPAVLGASYGGMLRRIHSLAPRSMGARARCAVHRVDRLVEAAPRTIESLRPHVDASLLRQVDEMIGRAAGHETEEVPATFVHADVFPEHLFLDPETSRALCLIDWADASWGDVADDFAMPGWYLGEEFLRAALAVYRPNEPAALLRRIYRLAAMVGIEDIRMADAGAPNAPLQLRIDVLRARAREGWLERVGA
jgi:hypothetical protein